MEVGVLADGHALLILRHRANRAEAMGETVLGVGGRPQQRAEGDLLHVRRTLPERLQAAAPPARVPVEAGGDRAGDHRTPPATRAPRRSSVSSSQAATAALKASACSSI